MIAWLKRIFIPHINNDHRPHILRDSNLRNIVIIVIFFEIATFLIPTLIQINRTGGMAAVLPAVLASLTNEERQDQNLKALIVNKDLNNAAQMKASDMATKGYFAHISPEGKTPWFWIEKAGYKYQYAGENLAINFNDSEDVADAWMASPTHKANIVKGKYTEVGTGVALGQYKGRETVFVAQVYANPITESSLYIKPVKLEKEVNKITPKEGLKNVLGAETIVNNIEVNNSTSENIIKQKDPTLIQKLLSSPRNNTNIVLIIIFGIIFISLLLYIFVKMKNHPKDMITNGLIVLAIVGAIIVANNYLSKKDMVILESVDYSVDLK